MMRETRTLPLACSKSRHARRILSKRSAVKKYCMVRLFMPTPRNTWTRLGPSHFASFASKPRSASSPSMRSNPSRHRALARSPARPRCLAAR